MRRSRSLPLAVAAALLLTGFVGLSPGGRARIQADAVVAVVDTGINPYHVAFRDTSPRAHQHPSTYIPGYPADAVPLHLTFGPDYWESVAADCERVWSTIEAGRLYWFPGTRIAGAVTFGGEGSLDCEAAEPISDGRILDVGGHGTMTASRAVARHYGACEECLLVAVQAPLVSSITPQSSEDLPELQAIRWAAANAGWIDAQSNSWGPVAPLWDPVGRSSLLWSSPPVVRAVEEVSQAHMALWASGNGTAFRFGVVGHPTLGAAHLTPSAVIVGGHDSGHFTAWPGFSPHVVSDACSSWAARHDDVEVSSEDIGGGTSGATPFSAGTAVRQLLMARHILGDGDTGVDGGTVARGPAGLVPAGPLADGRFTLEEWKRLLFVTASARPEAQFEDGPPCTLNPLYTATPLKWSDVPEGYPEYLHIGYGATDDRAVELAEAVLRGTTEEPDRRATDEYFALDNEVRRATYEVFSKP